jgi:Zn finger protein HypA/HybF involved in hydrogenase expression
MDLQLIEDWLWDQFSKVADTTKIEFMNFQRGLTPAEVYYSGEVAGPGALRCTNCGRLLQFERVDRIPPCPECQNTEFLRPAAEGPAAGGEV